MCLQEGGRQATTPACWTAVGSRPLDAAASYTLATDEYMLALKQGEPLLGVRDAQLTANHVMACITARKTVAPMVGGRVDLKMEESQRTAKLCSSISFLISMRSTSPMITSCGATIR